MTTVILDTDFLSSFLKIGRLELVKELYQVAQVYVTPSVYQEIEQTVLLIELITRSWIHIRSADRYTWRNLLHDTEFAALGRGEQAGLFSSRAVTPKAGTRNPFLKKKTGCVARNRVFS